MKKILCEFNEHRNLCRVLEDMGYQGGCHVKAVEYNGKERIVVQAGNIWKPRKSSEKLLGPDNIMGQ